MNSHVHRTSKTTLHWRDSSVLLTPLTMSSVSLLPVLVLCPQLASQGLIDLGPKPTCHSVYSSSLSFDFPQQGESGAALKGLEDWLTALCLVLTPLLFSIMKSFSVPGGELDRDWEFQWKLLEGKAGRIPWKFCRRKIQTRCDL